MEKKRVEIVLGKDGSVKVEAFGFKGSSCQEATKFLDSIFDKPQEVKLKDSFHEPDEIFIADELPSGHCG